MNIRTPIQAFSIPAFLSRSSLLLSVALIPACGEPPPPGGEYLPGQVWSYRARAGEEESKLVVLGVERDSMIGPLVHVSIQGPVSTPLEPPVLTLARGAMDASVRRWVGRIELQQEWLAHIPASSGSAWYVPVAEVLDRLPARPRGAFRREEPSYEWDPILAPPIASVEVRIACDDPGELRFGSLHGRRVHWEMSGLRFDRFEDLRDALAELERSSGGPAPRIWVRPDPATTYGELREVAEAATDLGLQVVTR